MQKLALAYLCLLALTSVLSSDKVLTIQLQNVDMMEEDEESGKGEDVMLVYILH